MKIGLSSYSLYRAMNDGEMDICGAIRWAAENGSEQIELVELPGFQPLDDPSVCKKVVDTAKDCGILLGNYSCGVRLMQEDPTAVRGELDHLKREIDAAASMGIRCVRHDVAHFGGSYAENTIDRFLYWLPRLAEGVAEIADYAAQYGITTSVENHGWFMNGSERVRMLIDAVNRPNFRLQLDVGNFTCVDEEPVIAVKRCLPVASVVHFKDFYLRKQPVELLNAGGGCWFASQFGTALCGSVVGWGDVDVYTIAKLLRESDFDGVVSLEFEGAEECKMACKAGLTLLKKLLKD